MTAGYAELRLAAPQPARKPSAAVFQLTLPQEANVGSSTPVCGSGSAHELEVIAEAIETADQLAALRALGAELGQGYFPAANASPRKPAPAAATSPSAGGRRRARLRIHPELVYGAALAP